MLGSLRGETYHVRLTVFEGPLDLLLHLIEREKLDISAVSLSQVTDQFLEYVRTLETVQPGTLADFLVMAARLVYIKSRALLPAPSALAEDEEEDPAEVLARQLREYKRFRDVALALQAREQSGQRAFTHAGSPPELERHLEAEGLNISELLVAAQAAFAAMPPEPPSVDGVVVPFKLTIHDQIRLIAESTEGDRAVPFRALLGRAERRIEIAVTLLAVLELIKRRQVVAEQDQLFGEIVIRRVAGSAMGLSETSVEPDEE